MQTRPEITTIETGTELKRWYWLKAELAAYCKAAGISYSGSKFEILDRIADVLDGKKVSRKKPKKPKSTFNWATETLTPETIITDSYKNGPNSRSFFKEYCGGKFSFNIAFMDWMKANTGKTLRDAVTEWERLEALKRSGKHKSDIPEGNQYNKYVRDFFDDNPDKTIAEARHYWKLKRALPLGRHVYERSDLELK